jgi:hypothetical protein
MRETMVWSELKFGKHKGKTLPQILLSDPDWFFNAIDEKYFKEGSTLHLEAKDIYNKARNIKIPNNEDEALVVKYFIHTPSKKYSHFDFVSANNSTHDDIGSIGLKSVIDMRYPRKFAKYDKLGYKNFLSSLKSLVFGNKPVPLTKESYEDFFNDPDNFS